MVEAAAENMCNRNGGTNCDVMVLPTPAGQKCVAVVADTTGVMTFGYGPNRDSSVGEVISLAAYAANASQEHFAVVCASGPPRMEAPILGGILPAIFREQPKREITLRYDPPTFLGTKAWVGITLNKHNPPVGCSYGDGVNPLRPFTVNETAETPINIVGIPTGAFYDVTVSCDNGRLTHSQRVQF